MFARQVQKSQVVWAAKRIFRGNGYLRNVTADTASIQSGSGTSLLNSTSHLRANCVHQHRWLSTDVSASEQATETQKRLKDLVTSEKVVVFMKGTPEEPMCGFSNAVTQILRMHGVPYASVNVLEDEAAREGVKIFSNWPTIPQVYINGDFIGGCDIMIDMHRNGDLIEQLQKVGIKSALLNRGASNDVKEDKSGCKK